MLSEALGSFFDFLKKDKEINQEIDTLDKTLRTAEEKAKILETLKHIDKL